MNAMQIHKSMHLIICLKLLAQALLRPSTVTRKQACARGKGAVTLYCKVNGCQAFVSRIMFAISSMTARRCAVAIRRCSKRLLLLLALISNHAYTALDHELGYDKDGLCSQNLQTGLEIGAIVAELGGAL